MRIAIFGAGAVGSLLAARLSLAGSDVVVFGRGAHADAIAENGLLLKDPEGERRAKVQVARNPLDAHPVDAVIVTSKGHHHVDAARAIAPLLTGDQPVVFAVNGIPWWYGTNLALPGIDLANDPARRMLDPEGEIGRLVGIHRTVGAVINSPNTIEAPGVAPLAEALHGAGINPGTGAPIRQEIWKKLMYTLCMAPIACLTGLRNGQIRTNPGLVAILDTLSQEAVCIARAHGCDVPDRIVIPATGAIVNHRQSMAQDLDRGRPVEYMPIVGLPRAYAHAAGLPCPTLDMLATLLEGRLISLGLMQPGQ